MRKTLVIAKKEITNFIFSPVGFIFSGLLLVISNWMYINDIFLLRQADLSAYWNTLAFLLSLFIPAISMGIISDEKKNGNWEVLLALPINEIQLTVGKFLGSAAFVIGTLSLSLVMAGVLFFLGRPDMGAVVGGFAGVVLLALSYLSLGIFFSSIWGSSIVAFLSSTIFLILNNLMGQELLLARIPTQLRTVVSSLSLGWRAGKFSSGLLEINDLVFFLSFIFVFINLTIIALRSRR